MSTDFYVPKIGLVTPVSEVGESSDIPVTRHEVEHLQKAELNLWLRAYLVRQIFG
jgi:hypothetical protein